MDVKSRREAERRNKADRVAEFRRVSACPFCGGAAATHVTRGGQRYFDCTFCGAAVTFTGADSEKSIELWETREGNSKK